MAIEHWQAPLWDAINRYVVACGGDPSRHVYGNAPRMTAVAEVCNVVRETVAAETRRADGAEAALSLQTERVIRAEAREVETRRTTTATESSRPRQGDRTMSLDRKDLSRLFDEIGVSIAMVEASYAASSPRRDGARDALRAVTRIREEWLFASGLAENDTKGA